MTRQIELIRTVIAALLIVAAVALIIVISVSASTDTMPPELPTLTAPPHDWQPTPTTQWILTSTPGPYPPPPPVVNTPAPYPQPDPADGGASAFLPVQVDVESYP